jgi:hypothetical protein
MNARTSKPTNSVSIGQAGFRTGRPVMSGKGGQPHDGATRRWRKFSPDLFDDPDGYIEDFGYQILRRSYEGRELSAVSCLRQKLRYPVGNLRHFVPHKDVIASTLLVPPDCPDLLAHADILWPRLDEERITDDQHLLVIPTIWFPSSASQHFSIRLVQEFAQTLIVDRYRVATQLIAHAPNRISLRGDFHIHLVISARSIGPYGFGEFVREILQSGCQRQMHQAWQEWLNG